jgi:hypothetical protein
MVEVVPDPPDIDPMNLKVQYGTRSLGQKGYILIDTPGSQTVVYQSDFKSDVIAEAQRRKGFIPIDGSESTYARQLAGAAGEQPLTEMMTLRLALTNAVEIALIDYLSSEQVEDQVLGEYEFNVSTRGETAVTVLARHESDTRWPLTFTINVSGSVTRTSQDQA